MEKKTTAVRHGGPGGGPRGFAKPKNTSKTLKRLLSYLFDYKFHLVAIVIAIIGSSLSGVAGTYFLKPIINDYVVPFIGQENPDLTGFLGMIGIMVAVYAFGVICSFTYNRLMLKVSTGTMRKIRVDMFRHLQDLPIKYYDTHTHGETMSRFTNDTDTLREMLSQGLPQFVSSTITVIGVFTMMVILSPILTLLVVFMFSIMIFAVKKIGSKSASYFIKQQKELGTFNGFIEEMIEGQKVVKVFSHEGRVKEEFDEINERLRQAASSANTFASILMPIMGNLSYVHYALTATAGALLAVNGYMDLGTIGSYLQYTRSFSQPITQISQQLNSVLTALAGAERIFNLLDETPEVDNGYVTLVDAEVDESGNITEASHRTGVWAWKHPHKDGALTYTLVKGDVRFEDVTFGYDENKTVLNGINLFAKPGQKIAFVGSTGAGKTTITNLINRFYDVPDGKIRYDGININKIKKDDLRRSLGMVLQDTHLFTGTIMENIRYGKLDATDEEVIEAAKLANAHSFIKHMPEGYNTILTSDGTNLSQGQRQLLAIARATVADPPVLILDEATSSIDTRTESLIEKGMDTLMKDRTVFVIAHRLSTVRNSNAIMVLENGKIIERGNHEDLIEQKGKYYQLYTGMFELS
ncbi:putative ABC transporter ATP-binding protein [bioreactor metagenome]|uniref:Putative ABC transporter ATP-binding protein n=1 Tax=bioreactor metagenome TaxID=1076179 RepID=A0A644XCF7_9ZZZZ